MRTTRIKLTKVNGYNASNGRLHETYADQVLMLRTAREVGDEEVVNNYKLGQLKKAQEYGAIEFERI